MTQQEKYDKHMKICKELNQVYIDKNNAYGDSFGKTFRDLGIMSAITRISDKYNRVVALAKGVENNVKDESIFDTLRDMANYAIMTLIEIEESQKCATTGKQLITKYDSNQTNNN